MSLDPEIFRPLESAQDWVIGQLGQSLDGRIATASGHSHWVNGPEDIRRLHRLRALADAVIVGAGTVASDDCRLTVREVEGDNPVRVVLDPRGRLPADRKVFTDGAAPTLVFRALDDRAGPAGPASSGIRSSDRDEDDGRRPEVQVVALPPGPDGRLAPAAILGHLRARGLRRILVEGGGITVSAFLEADALDRLHISIAPLIIGSGRPGITLPEIGTLDEAMRPPVRCFRIGEDRLFDLDLRAERRSRPPR